MKKKTLSHLLIVILIILFGFSLSGEDAQTILKKVDEYNSGSKAPADMEALMVMNIHKGSSVKTRELKAWTKNNTGEPDWRVMKFLSPADSKNIGLLILTENRMYLYLPEFRRIRRIASSSKKNSFQGSDFSFDDLDTVDFSESYTSTIKSEDDASWLLELDRKENSGRPYKKILLTVSKESYMPLVMEMFDNRGDPWKKMENKVKKIGEYYIMNFIKIEDKKKGSYTTLELKEIKLDQGLDNSIFTRRFLKRSI